MATSRVAIFCEVGRHSSGTPRRKDPPQLPRRRSADPSPAEMAKIVLQPRLCTLRSYGSGVRDAVIKTAPRESGEVTPFFASLTEYIESSRKSRDFEIVSGRLSMIVFAAAVTMEATTGNSLFKKLDLHQIVEAGGVCVAVVACAATFAWFSSARARIDQMFTLGCSTFVDSLIDNLVDGLFYEDELIDWPDEP